MQSQVGLRKQQSKWRWWNSNWAISHPKRWCCESAALNMPANLESLAVATGLIKVSFHSHPKEKQCQRVLKLLHNASKVMLKILQARLQQYVNHELPGVQAAEPEIKLPTLLDHRKARGCRKNIYFSFITTPKPLAVWITINSGKSLKRWEYQITWPASWEVCMQVRKQ